MKKLSFEFNNQLSPSYIEALLTPLEPHIWYSYDELRTQLQQTISVEGIHIVRYNAAGWALAGIVTSRTEKEGRSKRKYVRLSEYGRQVRDIYSTNRELFFDLFHFTFYSAWRRTGDLSRARFWIYAEVCDALWNEAPRQMDSFELTNRLQTEAQIRFPDHSPAFPERSVRAVFPWLAALTPPFLEATGSRNQYHSNRRRLCTPQLFHLATDFVYFSEKLAYGTSLSLSERLIEQICRLCLLDPIQFWPMADLTSMMVREFDIKRNQWGRSIVLASAPTWIDLPDYSSQPEETTEEDFDVTADDETDEDEGELWI